METAKKSGANKPTYITRDTVKRLLVDVKNIQKNPLHEHGVYYIHDLEDMMKGYALIIGRESTPYFGGFYFFEFHFPPNYPFSPPLVIYCTNQNKIRFNPNLYHNGKVCLSILNTWGNGDPWTACQTITTVLLSLCTLLNETPLLNEPGVDLTEGELIKTYNDLIEFANIDVAICNILHKVPHIYMSFFDQFYPIMIESFAKNQGRILEFCRAKLAEKGPEPIIIDMSRLYHIRLNACYSRLLDKLERTIEYVKRLNEKDPDGAKEFETTPSLSEIIDIHLV